MARLLGAVLITAISALAGETMSSGDLERKQEWIRQCILSEAAGALVPFSFTYGGQSSAALLPQWQKKVQVVELDAQRTERVVTWSDPASGLSVRCRGIEYHGFPTVEWTVYLKNTGGKESPILEGIQALDISLTRKTDNEFLLHHQTGDNCSARSYEPQETRLEAGSRKNFAPAGGRPTNGAYPYFNVEYDGGGLIAVVGWPGQWSAHFERDGAQGLRISAGQEQTHFKLLPGEEVRSPLVVLQFWKGDRIRSQNVWRRWMIAHNLPRPGGKLPPPFTSACMGLHQSAAGEIGFIDGYLKGGIKLDYWWMDAGWYPCKDWWQVGTWEPDPERFPKGIRAVSDYAHAKGMKLVLWFEPERVHEGTWLHKNHPDWLLGGQLLNLGNPEARAWLTDHVDKFITEQGVDLYRQDFNMDPLGCWRKGEAADRQGIAEIRHVEGYLAYWDELRRRHPEMLIDSCASGGRRNDLETLRRAVPLLRSDFQGPQNPSDPEMLVGNQGHTYGLSFWVPYYGTGIFYNDVYAVRSHLTPALGIGYSGDAAQVDWPSFKRRVEDWKRVADYFYGDYYPLTPYSLSEDKWIAWQFNVPQTGDAGPLGGAGSMGEGMVQAFRRLRATEDSMCLKLQGLEPEAIYEFQNLDLESGSRAVGREVLEKGLLVRLALRRQAAIIAYRRLNALAAVISADVAACEVQQAVAFTGKDSFDPKGGIAAYSWDFGDGTTASGPTVEHAYKTPGTYAVKLTVANRPKEPASPGASDTARATISVTAVDTTPPAIVLAASGKPDKVAVIFSKAVEQTSAEAVSNYSVDQGVKAVSATLEADLFTVTLTTSPLSASAEYALVVSNVKDRARQANTIAPGSRKTFGYSGMYGHWGLDEGKGDLALDSSGNGHHGALAGAHGGPAWVKSTLPLSPSPLREGVGGRGGMALSFDGVADRVETGTFFPELAMPFSITLWVSPAATQVEYADILGNHGEPFVGISLQQDGKKTNSFGFGFGDGKRWQGVGPVQLKAGEWQHIAVVCDGETAIFYIDGLEKSRAAAKGPLAPDPTQDFKLGQGYHSGRYFHGLLSDVRIYRKALSLAELAELAKR